MSVRQTSTTSGDSTPPVAGATAQPHEVAVDRGDVRAVVAGAASAVHDPQRVEVAGRREHASS